MGADRAAMGEGLLHADGEDEHVSRLREEELREDDHLV